LIRVYLETENERGLFIVDTAAGHMLDKQSFSNLFPSLCAGKNVPAIGRIALSSHSVPAMKIGEREIVLDPVELIDLSPRSRILGDEVCGILGIPMVLDFGLGYDALGGYFHIGRASPRVYEYTFPLEVVDSVLHTEDVTTGVRRVSFLIDTGMNTPLSVDSAIFDELESRGLLSRLNDSRVRTLSEVKGVRFGIISSVEIWGTPFRNVPAIESTKNAIGINLLKKFDFFINAKDGSIEISRNSQTKTQFLWDRSGLGISCSGEKILVDAVKPNSPAERVAIEVGTTVCEVNGQVVEANWQELCRLRDLFSTPGPITISLLVEQNGLRQSIELAW
jgi:predicted aspartyl protease